MGTKEIPKIGWCAHLILLNDECRTAGTTDTLKEELISTSLESARRLGEAFWMLERKKGQTFPQFARILLRLTNGFITGDTILEAVDKVVLEKFLQTLPRQAATNIRDKDPKTSKEAARLAQYYFQDRNSDPNDPRRGDYRRNQGDQLR